MNDHIIPRKPLLPIPEPIRGNEPGSFAEYTVTIRMPEIGRRTLHDNQLPPEETANFEALINDLPDGKIRPLMDRLAPDIPEWDRYTASYAGMTWLEVPWFFAETYYYRRMLEATGYFTPGKLYQMDPNHKQKRLALETLPAVLEAWFEGELQENKEENFLSLVYASLWGNQADLSLWPVSSQEGRSESPSHSGREEAQAHLVIDQAASALRYLSSLAKPVRIDFILDNTGQELGSDLIFADKLIGLGFAKEIHFHAKAHPMFVSDAIPSDIITTLHYLAEADTDRFPSSSKLGKRLLQFLENDQLIIHGDFFWNSPLAAWEMPPDLINLLSASQLVVSKGDANYRRLLGDRHWDPTTPFEKVLSYFPAPLLALRTIKAETIVGLLPGQAEALSNRDPKWLTDGKWGLVELFNPAI